MEIFTHIINESFYHLRTKMGGISALDVTHRVLKSPFSKTFHTRFFVMKFRKADLLAICYVFQKIVIATRQELTKIINFFTLKFLIITDAAPAPD